MKAILVDDEPDGIKTLKKLLELNCPEVEIVATCGNALFAKQKLEEMKPDLVFLDIRMPGMSGLDLLAELPEKDFEVIFVTAISSVDDATFAKAHRLNVIEPRAPGRTPPDRMTPIKDASFSDRCERHSAPPL